MKNSFCKICDKEVTDRAHYWKTHKKSEKCYYEEFYPKRDLVSNEKILFKNPEQYFSTDFVNKINLNLYLNKLNNTDCWEYLKKIFIFRKEQKELRFAPGSFELKSLMLPSPRYIEKRFKYTGGYNALVKTIGLLTRYNYQAEIKYNLNQFINIIIDTRENFPYRFEHPVRVEKLNFADYQCIPNPHNFYIERKELSDLIGALSNFDRFCREMERARENDAHIVVLVESTHEQLNNVKNLPQMRFLKTGGDFWLKKIRDLCLKFENVQFLCGGTRKECNILAEKLFKLKNSIRTIDLQYFFDMGIL